MLYYTKLRPLLDLSKINMTPSPTGAWKGQLTCTGSPPVSAVMSPKCVMPLSWPLMDMEPLFLGSFWRWDTLRRTNIDSS